jgi:hypothetical protein
MMMIRENSSGTITSPLLVDGQNNSHNTFYSDGYSTNGFNSTMRSISTASSVFLESSNCLTREAVDHIVHDPISSGFLLKFCEAHYCSENMKFITEIDRFRDQFHRDKTSWLIGSTWKSLDAEIDLKNTVYSDLSTFHVDRDFVGPLKDGTLIKEELWPSRILSREAVVENIINIWDTFLAGTKESKYWICIPSTALLNTMRRIKMIHIYGKEIFMEALIDPIKTIEKDIYPRFLLSTEYQLLVASLKTLEISASAINLKLSKPSFIILQRYQLKEIEKNLIKFSLNDLIEDQILYTEFLKYLEKIVSSENLLCIRAIKIFQESFVSTLSSENAKIFDNAWLVYRYFIASGSPYEISISYRKKKEVMRRLANPHLHLFDSIEQSALSALKSHYSSYILTKDYHELYRVILTKRNTIIPTSSSSSSSSSSAPGTTPQSSTCVSPSSSMIPVKLPPTRNSNRFFRTSCFSIG